MTKLLEDGSTIDFETAIDLLSEDVCSIVFIKKNGDRRYMRCTINLDMMASDAWPKTSKTPATYEEDLPIRVFDIDKQGWRSFKFDQIVSFGKDDVEY